MEIRGILDQVDSGAIQLPKFQRGYEWKKQRIRNFFNSLYNEYPIQSLLIWKALPDQVELRNDDDPPLVPIDVLLDGQQRITTLYGVMRGKMPHFSEGDDDSFPGQGLCFHLENEEFNFPNAKARANDDRWVGLTDVFVGRFESEARIISGLRRNPEYSNDDLMRYDQRLRRLSHIGDYELDIGYVKGEGRTLDQIVEIFNAVNSGGQKLSKGDLALAKMAINWPECRETLRAQVAEWKEQGLSFSLDWLLMAMNVVLTGRAEYEKDEKIREYSEDELKRGYTKTQRRLSDVFNLVGDRLGLDHSEVMIGPRSFYVMARLLDQRRGRLDSVERDRLLYWYIQAALRRTTAAPRAELQGDLLAIAEPSQGVDRLIQRLGSEYGSLEFQPTQFEVKQRSQYYALLYLMTRLAGSQDWGNGLELKLGLKGKQSRLHVHHIFPKKVLRGAGYGAEQINQLANLSFQTQETNQKLGVRPPWEYLPEVEKAHPGALESQWIPTDAELWRVENYTAFLKARRELLAEDVNLHLNRLRAGTE